jgi:serine/threonine-protein kinase HipA
MSDSSTPRRAEILQLGDLAGYLTERPGGGWTFTYLDGYSGPPISLTIPVQPEPHEFDSFPSPLEGLLPEGPQLESLLRTHKIDRHDVFRQLVTVGADLVGSLTVCEATPNPAEAP